MKKRYAFMDVVRLFAMLGIVYYHMVVSLYLCGIRQYESISPLFENNNIHVATVGVGLFFMISGAGLMLSTKDKGHLNLKDYYLKRATKILVPFYLVYVMYLLTFMALTNQGLSAVYDREVPVFSFIFTLLGMDAYVSSFGIPSFSLGIGEWFLGALVMMYIIFPLLRWGLLKNKWITLGIMTIYYIIILITYPLMPYASTVPGFVNFTCKVFEFFLGMFLILVIDDIPRYLKLSFLIPIIFFLVYRPAIPINMNLLILIENVCFFMFFSGLEDLFLRFPRFVKLTGFLCGYTYEMFLVHHVIIDYITLQHIGVPFSNKDILLLFIKEFIAVTIITLLVKGILAVPGLIRKRISASS